MNKNQVPKFEDNDKNRFHELLSALDEPIQSLELKLFHTLSSILEESKPQQSLEQLRSKIHGQSKNLNDLIAKLAEHRVSHNLPIFGLLQKLAIAESNEVNSFLAAWTAFNTNQLDLCLEYCFRPNEPGPDSLTLAGQTYLEIGKLKKARECLTKAVALEPKQLLAWHFLSKTELLSKHYTAAWNACNTCARIAPDNAENALLKAMIALDAKKNPVWIENAFSSLWPVTFAFPDNPDIIAYQIRLACKLGSLPKLEQVMEIAKWNDLKKNQIFIAHLGTILKVLGKQQWYPQVKIILDQLSIQQPSL